MSSSWSRKRKIAKIASEMTKKKLLQEEIADFKVNKHYQSISESMIYSHSGFAEPRSHQLSSYDTNTSTSTNDQTCSTTEVFSDDNVQNDLDEITSAHNNSFSLLSNSDSDNDNTAIHQLPLLLKNWAVKCQITHTALNMLLKILRIFHSDLPLDSRTLLISTPSVQGIKSICDGKYHHLA